MNKKNKIIILIGLLFVFSAHADTVDYIDMQLDAQIQELTSRRDKLKADLESCERNTRGYKIAGISTIAATGIGVVGNIKLAQEIEKQKTLKGRGGGASYGGGGGSGKPGEDPCGNDDDCKWKRECVNQYCKDLPDVAADWGCDCEA